MWFTKFIKNNLKSPAKMIKGLAKYGGRAILRRTGVFGIYGSFKKYHKLYKEKNWSKMKLAGKILKSTTKKNILRMLGPANYVRDWFKKGAKYTLKKFAWNKLVPMQIKKIIYLNQNFKSIFGREDILKESKKQIWERLGTKNKYNTDLWKLNQIEAIMKSGDNPREKKDIKYLLDRDFRFKVKSPQSHNFDRTYCRWNPTTGQFWGNIRGWPKKWTSTCPGTKMGRGYTMVCDINEIKLMLKTSNFGKLFHQRYYHKT